MAPAEISAIQCAGNHGLTQFTLPPRYRAHEEVLRRIYALKEVRDTGGKGFKAMRAYLFSLASGANPGMPREDDDVLVEAGLRPGRSGSLRGDGR